MLNSAIDFEDQRRSRCRMTVPHKHIALLFAQLEYSSLKRVPEVNAECQAPVPLIQIVMPGQFIARPGKGLNNAAFDGA